MRKDLGVTVLPQTCPTAVGVAWLSVAKGKVVVQTTGAGEWPVLAVAKARVDMPYRFLADLWRWLGAKVKAVRQSIFPLDSDTPQAVKVRVEVDCTPPAPGDQLPVVRVRVELEPSVVRNLALVPEVKVRVEPQNTTTTSTGTALTGTTPSSAPKSLPDPGSTAT